MVYPLKTSCEIIQIVDILIFYAKILINVKKSQHILQLYVQFITIKIKYVTL